MTVVLSSFYVTDEPQTDGRFWVTETHTLTDNSAQVFNWLAAADADPLAVMAERAIAIDAQLALPPDPPVIRNG